MNASRSPTVAGVRSNAELSPRLMRSWASRARVSRWWRALTSVRSVTTWARRPDRRLGVAPRQVRRALRELLDRHRRLLLLTRSRSGRAGLRHVARVVAMVGEAGAAVAEVKLAQGGGRPGRPRCGGAGPRADPVRAAVPTSVRRAIALRHRGPRVAVERPGRGPPASAGAGRTGIRPDMPATRGRVGPRRPRSRANRDFPVSPPGRSAPGMAPWGLPRPRGR